MNAILKDIILRLEMPKLVWCVDVADKDEYSEFKTSARMIVDSTASAGELAPWVLVHDRDMIRYFNRDEWFEMCMDYEERVVKISSPNNEEYESKVTDIETRISEIRVQQMKAYRDAENILFC